jgi:hypothetical protein
MDLKTVQDFFLWCMMINSGVYFLSTIAVFLFRDLLNTVHAKLFGFDEKTVSQSIHRYLGNFKLFITIFNFAPWIALMIIR